MGQGTPKYSISERTGLGNREVQQGYGKDARGSGASSGKSPPKASGGCVLKGSLSPANFSPSITTTV